MPVDIDRAAAAVRELLIAIGEDPTREGLVDPPGRVARAYAETFAGLDQDAEDVLRTTFAIDRLSIPSASMNPLAFRAI